MISRILEIIRSLEQILGTNSIKIRNSDYKFRLLVQGILIPKTFVLSMRYHSFFVVLEHSSRTIVVNLFQIGHIVRRPRCNVYMYTQ